MLFDLLQLITNPIYRITRINAHLLWLHLYFSIQSGGNYKLKHIYHRYSNAIEMHDLFFTQLYYNIFSFYFSNLEILLLNSYNWPKFCCNKKTAVVLMNWVYIITLESLRWRAFRRRRLKNIFRPSQSTIKWHSSWSRGVFFRCNITRRSLCCFD